MLRYDVEKSRVFPLFCPSDYCFKFKALVLFDHLFWSESTHQDICWSRHFFALLCHHSIIDDPPCTSHITLPLLSPSRSRFPWSSCSQLLHIGSLLDHSWKLALGSQHENLRDFKVRELRSRSLWVPIVDRLPEAFESERILIRTVIETSSLEGGAFRWRAFRWGRRWLFDWRVIWPTITAPVLAHEMTLNPSVELMFHWQILDFPGDCERIFWKHAKPLHPTTFRLCRRAANVERWDPHPLGILFIYLSHMLEWFQRELNFTSQGQLRVIQDQIGWLLDEWVIMKWSPHNCTIGKSHRAFGMI
jgi:hypothetical protein